MKTLIAVPCMDNVAAGFAQSLASLKKVGDCSVRMCVGSLIYEARNGLVKQALEMEADYILWLDSDMIFNPDILEKLHQTLEKENCDIATGLYFRRIIPYTPVLFSELGIKDNIGNWKGYDVYPKDKNFEVAGCGFGCVLMKTDCLLEMGETYNNWFAPIGNCGEDVAFCIRARELGYRIFCNPEAVLGHVGYTIITEQFYEAAKEVKQ